MSDKKGKFVNKKRRNNPCPCGSGKKYKKCCLPKDEEEKRGQLSEEHIREDGRFEDFPEENVMKDKDLDNVVAEELSPKEDSEYSFSTVSSLEKDENKDNCERLEKPASYKKPDLDLPELSKEEQQTVDLWWEEFMPYYRKRETDEMIKRITSFMEKYPALFVHLCLDQECLFELGAELGRKTEFPKYAELLMRIRKEYPEMYVRSFGYYDCDIIAEFILSGRKEEIPGYFSFFKQYPASDPDNLYMVINLLAAIGFDEELFELVRPVAVPVWQSPKVIGGGFAVRWLVLKCYIPYLSRQDYSDAVIPRFKKELRALRIPEHLGFNPEIVQRELKCAAKGPQCWDIKRCSNSQEVELFYHDITWGFCGFLHNEKGLSWVSSRFLACLLEDFFSDIPSGKRPREAFDFNEKILEEYIARKYQTFFWINGVLSISLLRSHWYFTDYLLEHRMIEGDTAEDNKQSCMQLFELCKKAVDSTDPGPRLYSAFPDTSFAMGDYIK